MRYVHGRTDPLQHKVAKRELRLSVHVHDADAVHNGTTDSKEDLLHLNAPLPVKLLRETHAHAVAPDGDAVPRVLRGQQLREVHLLVRAHVAVRKHDIRYVFEHDEPLRRKADIDRGPDHRTGDFGNGVCRIGHSVVARAGGKTVQRVKITEDVQELVHHTWHKTQGQQKTNTYAREMI